MARSWDEGGRYRAIKTSVGMTPLTGAPAGTVTPLSIMTRVGAVLKASMQRSFDEQKRGNVMWPPRAVPNVFGILADLAANRGVPARRFEARPAAIDTHDLARSIAMQAVSADEVTVGSVLPYASIINKGGKVQSATITKEMQKKLWGMIRSTRTSAQKASERKREKNRIFSSDPVLPQLEDALVQAKLSAKPTRTLTPKGVKVTPDPRVVAARAALNAHKASLRKQAGAVIAARPKHKGKMPDKTKAGIGGLRWLLNAKYTGQRLEGNIPARPFATLERADVQAVVDLVGVQITRAS